MYDGQPEPNLKGQQGSSAVSALELPFCGICVQRLRAAVELVENLGADHILHLRAGTVKLVSKISSAAAGPRAGDMLSLQLNPADLLLFHRGRLIGSDE